MQKFKIRKKIEDLKNKKKLFEDSDIINKYNEADSIAQSIQSLSNKEFTLKRALLNIENSLTFQPDLDEKDVLDLYTHAQTEIGEMVRKEIHEAMNFHHSLLSSRKKRLTEEAKRLQGEIESLQKERKKLCTKERNLLKYLEAKEAHLWR